MAQLRAHGLGDDILYRKIRLAAVQLNQRITAQSIANTWIRSKPDAFALARQYARKLANPYGASVLIKALISPTVPRAWRPSLVALRRRAQTRFIRSCVRGRNVQNIHPPEENLGGHSPEGNYQGSRLRRGHVGCRSLPSRLRCPSRVRICLWKESPGFAPTERQ